MIKSNIHNKMHINGILFTDLCTKKICNRHDFMNHSVEVCFAVLINIFRINEDLIIASERMSSSFYKHVWNRLQRIKSFKMVVESSDKNQYSFLFVYPESISKVN